MSVVIINIKDLNNIEMSDVIRSNIESLTNELTCALSMDYHRRNADNHNLNYTTDPNTVERKVEQQLMYKFTEIDINNFSVLHNYTTCIYERLHTLEAIYKLKLYVTICDKNMEKVKGFLLSEIVEIPMTKKGKPKKYGLFSILKKGFFW
jgi:hypothetical protein